MMRDVDYITVLSAGAKVDDDGRGDAEMMEAVEDGCRVMNE